ncbi:MAG: complex I NDUFA9 subunit family protein [Deltaproteobacteria bacterium]|nr:complex I NDUFA9 subunit family protein [Deltaproteobacteria bacterium]
MIFITGATGFVGRTLVAELVKEGSTVRCLVRDIRKSAHIAGEGVELVQGDVTDPVSVESAIGPDVSAVIHLVGIIAETRGASFNAVHVQGTCNVVNACVKKAVKRYIHISALGARDGARSLYHKTKWQAEEIIRASGLVYTIFRPSVIFGKHDRFTNLFAKIMRFSPVVFVPGNGQNLMQPVFVSALARLMSACLHDPRAYNKVFEVGGPEAYSFDDVFDEIARSLGKKVMKIHVPMPLMRLAAAISEGVLPSPPITRDQLIMLEEDNITEEDHFKEFGITPTGFRQGLTGIDFQCLSK